MMLIRVLISCLLAGSAVWSSVTYAYEYDPYNAITARVYGYYDRNSRYVSQYDDILDGSLDPVAVVASNSRSNYDSLGYDVAHASGFVSSGVIKMNATALSNSSEFVSQVANGIVVASSYDEVIFYSDGLDGRAAIVNARIAVNGESRAISETAFFDNQTIYSTAAVGWSFSFSDLSATSLEITHESISVAAAGYRHQSTVNVNGIRSNVIDPFGYYDIEIPIVFGEPVKLKFDATAYAEGQGDRSFLTGQASVDLGNSIYWEGINSVMVSGNPVTFATTSASGFDWSQSARPVPEPENYVLLIVGLGLVGASVRRRARLKAS